MKGSAATTPPTTAQQPPGTADVLIHEGANDYRLAGGSCWVAVGDFVVYIRKDGGGVVAEIYDDRINRINGLMAEAEARAEAR